MTVPRPGWTQSSFSPAAARLGGGSWAREQVGLPSQLLSARGDGLHSLCSSGVFKRPFFFFCLYPFNVSHDWSSVVGIPALAQNQTSFIQLLRFSQGERKTTALLSVLPLWANGGCELWHFRTVPRSGSDGSDLLLKALGRNYIVCICWETFSCRMNVADTSGVCLLGGPSHPLERRACLWHLS